MGLQSGGVPGHSHAPNVFDTAGGHSSSGLSPPPRRQQASDTPLGARTQRSRYLQLALAGRTGLELAPRSPSFPLSTLGLRTAPGVVAARLAEPVSVFAARSGPGSGAAGTRRRSRRLHLLAAAAPEPRRLAHGDTAQRAGSLWHPGGGSRPRGAPPRYRVPSRSREPCGLGLEFSAPPRLRIPNISQPSLSPRQRH